MATRAARSLSAGVGVGVAVGELGGGGAAVGVAAAGSVGAALAAGVRDRAEAVAAGVRVGDLATAVEAGVDVADGAADGGVVGLSGLSGVAAAPPQPTRATASAQPSANRTKHALYLAFVPSTPGRGKAEIRFEVREDRIEEPPCKFGIGYLRQPPVHRVCLTRGHEAHPKTGIRNKEVSSGYLTGAVARPIYPAAPGVSNGWPAIWRAGISAGGCLFKRIT